MAHRKVHVKAHKRRHHRTGRVHTVHAHTRHVKIGGHRRRHHAGRKRVR